MTRPLASLAMKECRALFPIWASCMVAVLAVKALALAAVQPAGWLESALRYTALGTVVDYLLAEAFKLAASVTGRVAGVFTRVAGPRHTALWPGVRQPHTGTAALPPGPAAVGAPHQDGRTQRHGAVAGCRVGRVAPC